MLFGNHPQGGFILFSVFLMDWLTESTHRLAACLLIVTRIIYKWLASEAADVQAVGDAVQLATSQLQHRADGNRNQELRYEECHVC